MNRIKHYHVEGDEVTQGLDKGALLGLSQGMYVQVESALKEKKKDPFYQARLKDDEGKLYTEDSDILLEKAFTDKHFSIYLVGPSKNPTEKGNKIISHAMLAVIDYNQSEPQSYFIKMRLYETKSGVSEGYEVAKSPTAFEKFQSDLQDQYAAIVAHERKEDESSSEGISDEGQSGDDGHGPKSPSL